MNERKKVTIIKNKFKKESVKIIFRESFIKKIFSLLFLFIFLYLPIFTLATTREFNIPSVNVEATINDDGSIDVVEQITYDFKGNYNGIIRKFDAVYNDTFFLKSVKIIDKDSNVTEAYESANSSENTYEINTGDKTEIKLYSKSSDESKTIEIKYRLENIVSKSETEGRLYWDFYTVENVSKVDNANLKLKFNGRDFDDSNSTYHVYGDGSISSNYDNGIININISNLRSILGVDLKFPSEYLYNSHLVDNSRYNNILNNNKNNSGYNNNSSGIVVFFFVIAIGSIIVIIYCKENRKTQTAIDEYRRSEVLECDEFYNSPPSNIPPALINYLISGAYVSYEMLPLSLFYLAYKGYYFIENVKNNDKKDEDEDLKFTRNLDRSLPEEEHLKFLIKMFKPYEINGSFTLLGIQNKLKNISYSKDFIVATDEWMDKVNEEADRLNMTTVIRGKTILTNYYENEREKWYRYKEYLEKVIQSQISADVLEKSTMLLIYAKTLSINSSKLEEFTEKLSKFNELDFNQIRCNNYFMYYRLYDRIYNNIESESRPNNTPSGSFDGRGFTGSSSGGDFGGGGGGGSDAF